MRTPVTSSVPRVAMAFVSALAVLTWTGNTALGDGTVTGHGRFERIKGQPIMGYAELYESNLYLSPGGPSPVGPSRRLGAPPGAPITHDGFYSIDITAGTYSILLNQPLFFVRPKVIPNVVINNGQTTTQHVELAIDYSTYFKDNNQWTGPANPWFQTFIATGTSITGVVFVFAGTSATSIDISILRDNGNADVRNWTVLGTRPANTVGVGGENWCRWRSGEIPTTPGTRYAVRMTGNGTFQPYKRNKDPYSYVGGQAYDSGGQAQNFDLNLIVFSDNDGTRVTMNKRSLGLGDLQDGNYGGRWGQTFIAHGSGLAAADVWAAGAGTWDLDFTWKVRVGGPTGAQVGPTKITKAAYQAFGAGLHGVSYNPGEVPLTSGVTYFVEFSNSPGFNPYIMTGDSFSEGNAYQDNTSKPSLDLSMTIVEYTGAPPPQPTIGRQPESITLSVPQGTNPPNGSFTVQNTGAGTLNYTVSEANNWMSLNPTAGASSGETDTIIINYTTASLSAGNYAGTITISDPIATNNPQTIPVTLTVEAPPASPGDFDGDGDVDVSDFTLFQVCFNGPNQPLPFPECDVADMDEDGDVDLADFTLFQLCFGGANNPPAASCS